MNRSPKITSLFYSLAALLLFAPPSSSQIPNQVPVGARPLSMGEAFVAVADDGNAIHWNPAGLANMERIQLSLSHADLFGLGIKNTYTSFLSRLYFIPPLTDYLSFGVAWSDLHTGDEEDPQEVGYDEDHVNFALAFKPPKSWLALRHLSLGVNVKYLQLGGKYDGITAGEAKGWGGDFGLLYDFGALFSGLKKSRAARDTAQTDSSASKRKNPINSVLRAVASVPQNLQFGLMVHDIGNTKINHRTGVRESVQFQQTTVGFSYRPPEKWFEGKLFSDPVLALDFNDRVHLGLEFWLAQTLALRAGWQKDWHTHEKASFAFGLGFKKAVKNFPEVSVDYALTDTPVLPNTTRQFGGALLIKNNPRAIRIVSAQIENVFASLYRHYAQPGSGFGSVKLKNVTDQELVAGVTFTCGKYSQPQAADAVRIPAQSTVDFPLRAVFKEAILLAESGQLSGEIKVTYDFRKSQYTTGGAVEFTLYEKNYLTWDDPGKAAAFVTPDNPHVQKFADQAFALQPDSTDENWWSRLNLYPALVLFRALQAYRINYRSDQALGPGLDKIQYPAELLVKIDRAGDCDDLSVLYASLLQNASRATAFISDTSHILIMFDTEVPAAESWSLPISPRRFIHRNGTLWIPIETTMIPTSTFFAAWENAVDKIDDSTWRIHDYAASHAMYPEGEVPVTSPLGALPDLELAVHGDLAALEMSKNAWLKNFEQTLEDTVRSLPFFAAAKKRNLFGVVLGQNDEYLWAKTTFQKILAQDSTFAPSLNNLGNIEFITGNFLQAEKLYRQTLAKDPASRGTWLNLAILYEIMKSEAAPKETARYQNQSNQALEQAARILLGDAQNAFALLGLPEESVASGKSAPEPTPKKSIIRKIKSFIDGGFKKYVRTRRIEGVALDRSGAKGRNETDPNRRSLLAWSY